MKNLFLYLNQLFPTLDHNAYLILKLVPYLDCNSCAIAFDSSNERQPPPRTVMNTPVFFIKEHKLVDKILRRVLYFFLGPEQGSNHLTFIRFYMQSLPLKIRHKPHAVLSTFQKHFPPMMSAFAGKKTVKALYLMDPTNAMWAPNMTSDDESKWFLSVLKRHDVIFTTKFIHEAMLSRGYGCYTKKIVDVSFPMINDSLCHPTVRRDDRITLLFAGTIYSDIRSPEYFLKIVSKLDERFRVLFIGYNTRSAKSFALPETKAEIITHPPIPHDQMLQEMANADILVNIGNSVPVHLPSKTLEYINTGKPFVNFYKFDECPTLSLTTKYPLCLNLSEQNEDIDSAAAQFTEFCINTKGKQLERDFIESAFAESTPQYIAKIISEELFGERK